MFQRLSNRNSIVNGPEIEKNCNFLHKPICRICASNVPWNRPKTLNYAYFRHFSQKNCNFLQKNVNFCATPFSGWACISPIKWPFSIEIVLEIPKKCQFLCNSILAHMCHDFRPKPWIPSIFSHFWSKIEKNCNFCAHSVWVLCALMSHVFSHLQYILYWKPVKNWKKLQFLCTCEFRWICAYVPWFCPKCLKTLVNEPFFLKNWKKLQFLCTAPNPHMSHISAIFWPISIEFVLQNWKKVQFFAIFVQLHFKMRSAYVPYICHEFG